MEELIARRRSVQSELLKTAIVKSLFEGRLDTGSYIRYLRNVAYYAPHSPVVMTLAAARCLQTHPALAAYLLHHAQEETGHDQWALEDLQDLGVTVHDARSAPPTTACSALVGYTYYLAAHDNPIGIFGWMYVLEAVGNDLGAIAAEQLRGTNGLGHAVRFIERHGESDRDHTRDLTAQISQHVRRPADQAAINETSRVVADLYVQLFHEVGGEQRQWV